MALRLKKPTSREAATKALLQRSVGWLSKRFLLLAKAYISGFRAGHGSIADADNPLLPRGPARGRGREGVK